jgi:hypothetical protein
MIALNYDEMEAPLDVPEVHFRHRSAPVGEHCEVRVAESTNTPLPRDADLVIAKEGVPASPPGFVRNASLTMVKPDPVGASVECHFGVLIHGKQASRWVKWGCEAGLTAIRLSTGTSMVQSLKAIVSSRSQYWTLEDSSTAE